MSQLQIQPQHDVWVVTQNSVTKLPPTEISLTMVGGKAFGLATVPQVWTQPFFVISSDIFEVAKHNGGDPTPALTENFLKNLSRVASSLGLEADETILLRSSGSTESLEERGKFFSHSGHLTDISEIIRQCCGRLVEDSEARQSTINFVVQRQVTPVRLKGHLSNERRLAKEPRDWFFEIEDASGTQSEVDHIAIRRWREGEAGPTSPLICPYSISIADSLRKPARWATDHRIRMHFEWVWDGVRVYIVQADPVLPRTGTNPMKLALSKMAEVSKVKLKKFRPITRRDGERFDKVRNVFTYSDLKLPTAPLYILDDPVILDELAHGRVSRDVLADLTVLTSRPLVIRSDISTNDQELKELLPRSEGLQSADEASAFLTEKVPLLVGSENRVSEVCVLAHHFIPAIASAWSYAEPHSRKVLIEALWGIPEGMYYFSHDTFEVDTFRTDPTTIKSSDKTKFPISARCRYKHHFVTSTASGEWKTQQLGQPFDWKCSIREPAWIREIAYESRLLASQVGHPLNVMWFIDLPESTGLPKILPWFHTRPIQKPQMHKGSPRNKFVSDRDYYVETIHDIETLTNMGSDVQNHVKRIRIRPKDASLLRDKDFATRIGELAKMLNAVVVLEGGMLSHTYYVLTRTNAKVETVDDFVGDENIREYDKLVRDYIPRQIAAYGEKVRVGRLHGDQLIEALRTKLVEEAVEALDAPGGDSLTEELADVSEVVDSLLSRLSLKKGDLEFTQRTKRRNKGGFKEGYILLETRNPSLVADAEGYTTANLVGTIEERDSNIIEVQLPQLISNALQRSIDKRYQGESTESLLTLEVPLLRRKWETTTGEFSITDERGIPIKIHCRILGKRLGSVLRLEIAVVIPTQLRLKFHDQH